MFNRRKEQTELEGAVDRAIRELDRHEVGSDEYVKALDAVVKLHAMKAKDSPPLVSRDTLVLAATNLIGILMVIKHENVNVITSKALNMILRAR
jgi:hypothetical protein